MTPQQFMQMVQQRGGMYGNYQGNQPYGINQGGYGTAGQTRGTLGAGQQPGLAQIHNTANMDPRMRMMMQMAQQRGAPGQTMPPRGGGMTTGTHTPGAGDFGQWANQTRQFINAGGVGQTGGSSFNEGGGMQMQGGGIGTGNPNMVPTLSGGNQGGLSNIMSGNAQSQPLNTLQYQNTASDASQAPGFNQGGYTTNPNGGGISFRDPNNPYGAMVNVDQNTYNQMGPDYWNRMTQSNEAKLGQASQMSQPDASRFFAQGGNSSLLGTQQGQNILGGANQWRGNYNQTMAGNNPFGNR